MAIIKMSTNNKCWIGCRENGTLLWCWGECKLIQPLWKTVSVSHFSRSVVSNSCDPLDCLASLSSTNSRSLLKLMSITMEGGMEIPLKTRNKSTIWPSNPAPSHIPWGDQNWNRHMYPNVHCSTITITRTWKQPACPLTDEWIKKL